ncbi:MAG: efflux RND transporter periplasmic adaptor subunit [Patescibacteria group bacterium]|nr:efflux RND transporter periplasmic adaptor subunit [Patescibacteria group bacterium]
MFERIKKILRNRRNLAVIILLLIAAFFFGRRFLTSSKTSVQYQTADAQKGTLVTSVTASGNVSAGDSVTVSTTATGVVSRVFVKNGDKVEQGQKIAEITLDQDSQQRASSAWSSYLSAKNSLASANQNVLTVQQSIENDKSSLLTAQSNANGTDNWDPTSPAKQKLDESRRSAELALQIDSSKMNSANTQILKAQADLNSAWLAYQSVGGTITAPITGVVSNLTVAEGSAITPSSSSSNNSPASQKLATITVPNGHVQAVVDLSEIDAPKVSAGQKATLTLDAFPGKTFTGKVTLVDTNGQISSGVTTYPATVIFDNNPGGIYPNMGVTSSIITAVKEGVLLVPSAAVQTTGGQSTVRVQKNGQITAVEVQTGDSNDTQTEIISGINDGDTVIIGSTTGAAASGQNASSPFSIFGGGNRGFGGGGAVIRRIGGD